MQRILILTLFSLVTFSAIGQDIDASKNVFLGVGFKHKLSKKTSLKWGQMVAYDHQFQKMKFTQFKLGLSKKLTKKFSTDLYYKPLLLKGNTKDILYHRLSASVHHSSKFLSKPLKNSITVDWFFPQLKKYQYRLIYTLKYSFKNKVLPLRMTPYVKGQIFYYYGGKPISYYDETGEDLMAQQAPNGLHRYRLTGGLRFRPMKRFYVSLYYTLQKEFNTNLFDYRQLNVPNRSGTKIKSPFNNYQVLGVSLSYNFKRKKKKKKRNR